MSLAPTLCPQARTTRLRTGPARRPAGHAVTPTQEKAPAPRSGQPSPEQAAGLVPSNDEDLLSRYRDARRAEDLDELFRRYSVELSHYFARYLGDSALAEDVLQDTFLQVHTKCHLYRDGWPARHWLYAIAMHRAVDALRRARRMPRIRFDQPAAADEPTPLGELVARDDLGPLEELQERERQEWVREALSRLAESHRQVLVHCQVLILG